MVAAAVLLPACRPADPPADAPDADRLPPAAAVEARSPDSAAAELARAMGAAEGERERIAVLLAAVERAGFAVRDLQLGDSIVRAPAQPSQGLAFIAGEVFAFQRLFAQGHTVALADLAEALRTTAPVEWGAGDPPLDSLLLEGIRAQAASERPTQRFWARFIVELGRRRPGGDDLLDPSLVRDDVRLDAVQAAFVLLRYAGDMWALESRRSPPVQRAAVLPLRLPALPRALAAGGDCELGDMEAAATEAGAVVATAGFGAVLDAMGERATTQSVENFKTWHSAAGNALGLAKFIAAGAFASAKIEIVDGPPRMRRTKSTQHPGDDPRRLRATLEIDPGKWQFLNCTRAALNAAGLDFDVGQKKPLADVPVTWHAGKGKARGTKGVLPMLHFRGNMIQTSDANGQATIVVEGNKQPRPVPAGAPETDRPVSVYLEYTLKGNDVVEQLKDALSAAIGGPFAVATELLYRMAPRGVELHFTLVDFATDYRVDYGKGGVRFTGVKCGDPEGEWKIDLAGDIQGKLTIGGRITTKLDAEGRGEYDGRMDIRPSGIVRRWLSFKETTFGGTARFEADAMRLTLQTTRAAGGLDAAGTSIPVAGSSETFSMPVQAGRFCDGH